MCQTPRDQYPLISDFFYKLGNVCVSSRYTNRRSHKIPQLYREKLSIPCPLDVCTGGQWIVAVCSVKDVCVAGIKDSPSTAFDKPVFN